METVCEQGHKYNPDIHSMCPVCHPKMKCMICNGDLPDNYCLNCRLSFPFELVQEKPRLVEAANTVISLGAAPDGLPWIL